jgi:ADP-ribosylglycohydrolase
METVSVEGELPLADIEARARGALLGLALGDALGMPTQMLPRERVRELFPHLEGLMPGPWENEQSRGRPAGAVSDDTEQALLLADCIVAGAGHVDGARWLRALAEWAERRGQDQLGPSTAAALAAFARGVAAAECGRTGTTNGAAMRAAPLGIAFPLEPLSTFLAAVEEASRPTHGTGLAMAGAAAVAAAVSVGVAGGSFPAALDAARTAATGMQPRGAYAAGPSVAARIAWAVELVRGRARAEALDLVDRLVGTGTATQEAVPAAFALLSLAPSDPWRACLWAAHLGGDADTVAAMVGAMGGALLGEGAFPLAARQTVEAVNDLRLSERAAALLRLRQGRAA